jgi:imidazole glycerol phosphate synthase subunit HisF
MDAKRLVPVLHLNAGRIVDPVTGVDLGPPSQWARRLEMEGADELLFVAPCLELDWVQEVAGVLFIPFALEAPFKDAAEAAAALAAGADKVVVGSLSFDAHHLGRARVAASLEVDGSDGWSRSLAHLEELGEAGAGEILLTATAGNLAELCCALAQLPTTVILRCSDPADAVVALAHGADGLAFPAGLRRTSEYKDLLGAAGVALRR